MPAVPRRRKRRRRDDRQQEKMKVDRFKREQVLALAAGHDASSRRAGFICEPAAAGSPPLSVALRWKRRRINGRRFNPHI